MERPITWEQIKRANKLGLINHVVIHDVGPFGEDGDASGYSMNPKDANWIEDYMDKPAEEYKNGEVLVFDCGTISQAITNYMLEDDISFEMGEDVVFFDTDGVDEYDLRYIFREDIKESRRRRGRTLKEKVTKTYVVPEWALPALINGDYSGLDDDEIEAIEEFEDSLKNPVTIQDDYETFFAKTNDLPGEHGRLGNTCVEVVEYSV